MANFSDMAKIIMARFSRKYKRITNSTKICKYGYINYGFIFEKRSIMAICTMANFFKILAIMDLQFMAKKNLWVEIAFDFI